jgi:hypothetical protein
MAGPGKEDAGKNLSVYSMMRPLIEKDGIQLNQAK